MNVFDIIGPIMIGPSSSHTAGACNNTDAKYGWYRFTSRFALPVYDENNLLERYNIFRIEMLIRHASDDKLYLYDMVNVKKEAGTPPQQ